MGLIQASLTRRGDFGERFPWVENPRLNSAATHVANTRRKYHGFSMAKFDWDKVNVESLDYRHKKEHERRAEAASLLIERASNTASLYKCKECGREFKPSEYRYHFAEAHFSSTDTLTATILIVKVGVGSVLCLVLPTCIFEDVWEVFQHKLDFNQSYSLDDIQEKIPGEIRKFAVDARYKDLSDKTRSQALSETAILIRQIVGRLTVLSWTKRSLSVKLRLARFNNEFIQDLFKALGMKSKAVKRGNKITTRGKNKIKLEITKIEKKLEQAVDEEHKMKLKKIQQRLIDELAAKGEW